MKPSSTAPVQHPPGSRARTGVVVALCLALIGLVAVAAYLYFHDDDGAAESSVTWSPVEGASPSADAGTLVALGLRADGAGPGTVEITGLQLTPEPSGTALPWTWAGAAAIPDGTLKMEVRGTGEVSCTISVSGKQVAENSGTGLARCAISRTGH